MVMQDLRHKHVLKHGICMYQLNTEPTGVTKATQEKDYQLYATQEFDTFNYVKVFIHSKVYNLL